MSDVTVLHLDRPTARKEHACSNCGRVIGVGERYERQDNTFDGRRYAFKVCAHCIVVTSRAVMITTFLPDEGMDFYWIEDTFRENAQDCSDLRMLVNLRRRWRDSRGNLVAIPTRPSSETP